MEVLATASPARRTGSVAGVRAARVVAVVLAGSPSVAHVRIAQSGAVANLFDTDSCRVPEVTGTSTVTGTIQAAGLFQRLRALVLDVSANDGALASAGAVADSAEAAFILGVGVGIVVGTGTFVTSRRAGAAVAITCLVAAVPVNTEPAITLVVVGTRPAIGLLFNARGAVAVVTHAAVVIRRAAIAAGIGSVAAGVRTATLGAGD